MLYRYSICRKRAPSPTIACKIATTGTNTHNPGIEWYRSYFSRWFRWRDHTSQVLSCSFKNAAPICPGAESGPNRNSSSGNLIPNRASGLVGWDLQKSKLHGITAPANPSPPNLQPQRMANRLPAKTTLHRC